MSIFTSDTIRGVSLPKMTITASHGGKPIRTPDLPASVIIASIISVFLGLALPLTILQVYDRILPNQSTDTLLVLMLGLVGILVIDSALKILRSYIVTWLAGSFAHKAHVEAMHRILKAHSDQRSTMSVSKQIEELKALQSISDQYGSPSRLLIVDIPASLVFLAFLFIIGGPIGFVPIFLLAIFTLRTARMNQKLQEMVRERSSQDQRKYDFLLEVLAGLNTIKSMALEPVIMRRFERLQRSINDSGFKYIDTANQARDASATFTALTTVGIVSVGALLVIYGFISIGAVAACTLLAGQVIQPLLRGVNHWTDMQRVKNDYQEASKLFALPADQSLPTESVPVTGRITVNNINYHKTNGRMSARITGLSLQMQPGDSVAISGKDGSGRSTFLQILSGDLMPTGGEILIDEYNLFGPKHDALRKQIAYVGHNAQVFTGTILQNLTLFGTQTDPGKARLAADLIGLEKDIHLLPQGYDTMLGGGLDENLTTSFIQRIAIARALAIEPKILLLDDANGELDVPGETALISALERIKGQVTMILVSHRPSFRAIADKQLMMDEGHLSAAPAKRPPYTVSPQSPGAPADPTPQQAG